MLQYILQVLLMNPGDPGPKLRICKINSQPEIVTDVKVWASSPDYPRVTGEIRNLHYDAVYSNSYTMGLLERSFYSDIWGSPIDGSNHGHGYATDDSVDNSQAAGNYRSKPGFQKPWLEIHLASQVEVSGLEITSFGFQDKKRFKKVIVRAGLTRSPVSKGQGGNDLLTHNPFVYEYVDYNLKGEVIYITFPEPIVAKYILLQGNDNPSQREPTDSVVLELAEVRVVQCKP